MANYGSGRAISLSFWLVGILLSNFFILLLLKPFQITETWAMDMNSFEDTFGAIVRKTCNRAAKRRMRAQKSLTREENSAAGLTPTEREEESGDDDVMGFGLSEDAALSSVQTPM